MMVPYQQITCSYRRLVVIGDIHGCWDELCQILELSRFSDDDLLLTVGDFLDRGPGSWEVARFLREKVNAFSVIGNHERRVAGVVRGSSKPAWSQKQSLSKIPKNERTDWAEWLESLPAIIETPHAIISHARLDPSMPLTEQNSYHTSAVGGPSITIELDKDGVPLWFRQMRFEKPVCIGHVGYDRVVLVPDGLYALDTGAVHGGQLTAVVFPDSEIIQVPARRDYHYEARAAWRISQHALLKDPLLWTLSQVITVINGEKSNRSYFTNAIRVLNGTISKLGIEQRGRILQSQLRMLFGDAPPPGPARGEYFKTVKRAFSNRSLCILASRLLKDRPITFQDFAIAFPDLKICDASAMFDEIDFGNPSVRE